MGAVFAKTAKGQEEVASRTGRLPVRARRLLILIDGKRSVADLESLVQMENLRSALGALEEEGYIALAASPAEVPVPCAPPPDPRQEQRLQQARRLMSEALRPLAGTGASRSLLERIGAATSLEELREAGEDWFQLLAIGLDSRWEAEDLRHRLLKLV